MVPSIRRASFEQAFLLFYRSDLRDRCNDGCLIDVGSSSQHPFVMLDVGAFDLLFMKLF
jgi:hypothetical protein